MDVSFTSVPQRRELNLKSIARTTFGASAIVIALLLDSTHLRLGLRAILIFFGRRNCYTFFTIHHVAFDSKVNPGVPITLTRISRDACPFTKMRARPSIGVLRLRLLARFTLRRS